jgi:hypothetical protein
MISLTSLNRYMKVDEIIVTIGNSGISGIRKEISTRNNTKYIVIRRYGH